MEQFTPEELNKQIVLNPKYKDSPEEISDMVDKATNFIAKYKQKIEPNMDSMPAVFNEQVADDIQEAMRREYTRRGYESAVLKNNALAQLDTEDLVKKVQDNIAILKMQAELNPVPGKDITEISKERRALIQTLEQNIDQLQSFQKMEASDEARHVYQEAKESFIKLHNAWFPSDETVN